MANELLSVPVATGTMAIAAGALAFICRKLRELVNAETLSLMGVLGAFVFAGQMVNFQLPAMPGTSGHMVGAVLLALVLGPDAGAIVISSVVIIQCLIFQDGGLLALGCNIINMALVPSYLGYAIYKALAKRAGSNLRIYAAALLACIGAMEAGAALVPVEAALSRVLVVPFSTFLVTMLGVHLLVGIFEGLITVAVLCYLRQLRPDLVHVDLAGKARISKKATVVTLLVLALLTGAVLSLFASDLPDALEWSYASRPDQLDFKPIINNGDPRIEAVDKFQSRYSLMPDYSLRKARLGSTEPQDIETSAGWTSFAAVVGSVLTMAFIWLAARLISKKPTPAG